MSDYTIIAAYYTLMVREPQLLTVTVQAPNDAIALSRFLREQSKAGRLIGEYVIVDAHLPVYVAVETKAEPIAERLARIRKVYP